MIDDIPTAATFTGTVVPFRGMLPNDTVTAILTATAHTRGLAGPLAAFNDRRCEMYAAWRRALGTGALNSADCAEEIKATASVLQQMAALGEGSVDA